MLEPSVSSIYSPVTLEQDLSFLMIGERTNAVGSKKFREAMLDADYDTCLAMATEQVKDGVIVLDVGVSRVTGEDGSSRVLGDVDPAVAEKASWMAPNPGGVGPMTRVMLLANVVQAAERQAEDWAGERTA